PLLRPVWCRAGPDSFSSTVIRVPGAARLIAYAVDRPTMPPPITSTSQSYARRTRATSRLAPLPAPMVHRATDKAVGPGGARPRPHARPGRRVRPGRPAAAGRVRAVPPRGARRRRAPAGAGGP